MTHKIKREKEKKEKSEIVDIIFTTISNLLWFGAWLYIIFILHHSGWWILLPMFFHFATDKTIKIRNKK